MSLEDDFLRVARELSEIEKKMYECVDKYDDPFDGNRFPCYKRWKPKYDIMKAKFNMLWKKLMDNGYSERDIVRLLGGLNK